MRRARVLAAAAAVAMGASAAGAYPLDAWEETGIHRLEAYYRAREQLVSARRLAPGALLPAEKVELRLSGQSDFELPPPDPTLDAALTRLLGVHASAYAVALLDLSDPAQPRYAEHHGTRVQNPGSVGKVVVALAWFQALADRYPDDLGERARALRDTAIRADGIVERDHHVVPFWKPGDDRVQKRPLRAGDVANLWTYLDWMLSSSSNAAASVLMAQLVLFHHYGEEYPVDDATAAAFFERTSKAQLRRIFLDAIWTPLARNGIDPERLRQGSFFTREGKNRVPGTNSLATARELMRFLVRMEQGELVDAWSSRELKRLLYLTDARSRYAGSPALDHAAVYYKSGSLYSCREEPGYQCQQYLGNVRNYLNSIVIVEDERDGRSLHYLVVVLSNVLRVNSAEAHRSLAGEIQALIDSLHPASD